MEGFHGYQRLFEFLLAIVVLERSANIWGNTSFLGKFDFFTPGGLKVIKSFSQIFHIHQLLFPFVATVL